MLYCPDDNENFIKEVTCSLGADASSGRTKDGLVKEMNKLQRTISLGSLLIEKCMLYGMNRMMQSPCKIF